MTPSTLKLHQHLIRALRGMLNAWEKWLQEQPKQ